MIQPCNKVTYNVYIPLPSKGSGQTTPVCSVPFPRNFMSTSYYYELVSALNNDKQKTLHDFVQDWYRKHQTARLPEKYPEISISF